MCSRLRLPHTSTHALHRSPTILPPHNEAPSALTAPILASAARRSLGVTATGAIRYQADDKERPTPALAAAGPAAIVRIGLLVDLESSTVASCVDGTS